jgi:hypothetical protein
MATKQVGGGSRSRNVVEPKVRTGAARREINPKAVSQIGSSMGNRATDQTKKLDSVEKFVGPKKPISVPLGNEVALNVGKGGCGAGRTLYGKSGAQQQYGPVAGSPKPQGRDILRDFGPDVPGRGGRS